LEDGGGQFSEKEITEEVTKEIFTIFEHFFVIGANKLDFKTIAKEETSLLEPSILYSFTEDEENC
jgi:septum formation topological specificity factor MinE